MGLARTLKAHVILLHVFQSPPWAGVERNGTLPHAYSRYIQDLETAVAHRMQACLARVTAAGLAGESAVVHGVPFQEILETAKRHHVDLIIMGTHGRTGLPHVLVGSVAEKVLRLAPCPVLVVRQPIRPTPTTDAAGAPHTRGGPRHTG
jgi:nucleotide-binding universal stress UspA family protein